LTETHDKRRMARIPLTCTVVVREKFATWTTETQDVSARGCRIALRRPLTPGTLVHLCIARGDGATPLEVVGQVAWARKAAPMSAGVTFVSAPREPSGAPAGNWIDTLVAGELRRVLDLGPEATGALTALGSVALHLGTPAGASFDPSEMAVLRAARDTAPLATVGYSPDGLRSLLGLLERGAVTVRRTNSDPEGWKRAFSLVADSACTAYGHAPQAIPDAVIVPPLPETLWRQTAIEKMTTEYLRKG